MTSKQRIICIQEAQNYTDRNAYISDLYLSSIWETEEEKPTLETLGNIYNAVNRSIKEIATAANLSQRALAERFAIPYRTMEDWAGKKRECPIYIRLMIQEILKLL